MRTTNDVTARNASIAPRTMRLRRRMRLPSPPQRRWLCRMWPQVHDSAVHVPRVAIPQWRAFGAWFGSTAAGCGAVLSVLLAG